MVQALPLGPRTNLQGAYIAGPDGVIELTAALGPLIVRDNPSPLGTSLFSVQDNSPADVFTVSPTEMAFGVSSQRLFRAENVIAGYGGIEFYPDDYTRTDASGQNAAFAWTSTLTSTVPGGGGVGNDTAPNFVNWAGEIILTEQGNLFNTQSLFSQSTTIICQGANTGPVYTMINQPAFTVGSSGGARTGSQQNAVRSQIRIGPHVAGSFTLTSAEAYFATAIFSAAGGFDSTITTLTYLACKDQSTAAGGGSPTGVVTFNAIDFVNFSYASTIRGINSAMSNGTFIRHTGTAPAEFGGVVSLGAGATVDWSISRVSANLASLATGDSLRISTGSLFFGSSGSVALSEGAANRLDLATGDSLRLVAGELQFAGTTEAISRDAANALRIRSNRVLGFGDWGALAGTENWNFGYSAVSTTITIGGDYSDVLYSTPGSPHTINAALSNFATVTVNAPSGTLGTGSVTDGVNLLIQTTPGVGTNRSCLKVSGNPSGGTLNFAIWQSNTGGIVRVDGRLDINRGIALGGGAAPTLGTIGGSGPTAAGQAQWAEIDIGGTAHWIPVWT